MNKVTSFFIHIAVWLRTFSLHLIFLIFLHQATKIYSVTLLLRWSNENIQVCGSYEAEENHKLIETCIYNLGDRSKLYAQ